MYTFMTEKKWQGCVHATAVQNGPCVTRTQIGMKMKYACLPRTELLPSFPSSRFAAVMSSSFWSRTSFSSLIFSLSIQAYPLPFEAPTPDNAGSTVDLWTADFWLRFVAILVLVLLGGVFAGGVHKKECLLYENEKWDHVLYSTGSFG